jgi:hypothetical protein
MKKTEDILERLKGQMPQVPDGDLLTENIMQAIAGGAAAKPGRIVPLWLNVLRVVSSAAAVFLIALLIGLKGPDAELSGNVAAVENVEQIYRPMATDVNSAIRIMETHSEKRKARQIRQTQIKNLYAKF